MNYLSTQEISNLLQMNSSSIMELVSAGLIPYTKIPSPNGDIIRFAPPKINTWLQSEMVLNMDREKYLARLRKKIRNGIS